VLLLLLAFYGGVVGIAGCWVLLRTSLYRRRSNRYAKRVRERWGDLPERAPERPSDQGGAGRHAGS
jgi:hypothetical protein